MTVLVADEDELILAIVSDFLKEKGINVLLASDLARARRSLEQSPVDAVVLDIQVPDGLGSRLSREIRQSSLNPETPIIVLSACIDPDELNLTRQPEPGLAPLTPPNLELLYLDLRGLQERPDPSFEEGE